jgi:drug/metabolite transporter (DMT)-like permease
MPQDSQPTQLAPAGVAVAAACCALWGGNAVAVKAAVPTIPAFGCAGLRFLISLPIIAMVCRAMGQPLWVGRRHLGLLAAHAALTFVQIGTFNVGTSLGLAGRSSVFINIHPLVVAPLAWLLLGERLGVRAFAGLAAAALGVLALVAGGPAGGSLGDAIVLGSGVIFGLQTIAQKKTFPLIPPATLLLTQSVAAIPLFLGYSAAFEGFDRYQFTRASVAGLLYQGLAVSGLCFTTWMILLRRYPAGQLAAVAFLTPIFGVGLGNLVRGEPLTWPLVVGGALVGVGIYLVASDRQALGEEADIALPGEDAP